MSLRMIPIHTMKFEQRVFDFQGRRPIAVSNRPAAVGLIYCTVVVADSPGYHPSAASGDPPRSTVGTCEEASPCPDVFCAPCVTATGGFVVDAQRGLR